MSGLHQSLTGPKFWLPSKPIKPHVADDILLGLWTLYVVMNMIPL